MDCGGVYIGAESTRYGFPGVFLLPPPNERLPTPPQRCRRVAPRVVLACRSDHSVRTRTMCASHYIRVGYQFVHGDMILYHVYVSRGRQSGGPEGAVALVCVFATVLISPRLWRVISGTSAAIRTTVMSRKMTGWRRNRAEHTYKAG